MLSRNTWSQPPISQRLTLKMLMRSRLIRRSHYLAKKVHRRLLLKLTGHIQTAAVVEKHHQAHISIRARHIADRFQLAVNPQLKILKLESDDGNAFWINYGSWDGNEIGNDSHRVFIVNFIAVIFLRVLRSGLICIIWRL